MSLRSLFQSAAAVAFNSSGDVPKAVTYERHALGDYDPSIGERSRITSVYALDAVIYGYEAIEIDDAAIKPNDQRALIRQAQLPVQPETTDTLIINGLEWGIVGISQDPAGATWELQLRRG